jgi:CRP/FNR family cyclic AMP-dependent transcriptional regulator
MDTTTIMHWMQAIPFFSPFNKNELEVLASDQRYFYKYAEGDKIIEEGQTDVSFHVLLKGAVRITKASNGSEVLINKLKEGTVFGELSILRKGKRTSTVTAEMMSITMTIKPKHMDDWNVHLQNKFRDQLLKVVLKRFEVIDNKHVEALCKLPSKDNE